MKTMVDNAKIARMEKSIKETDAKVKNIKSVPPSTTADAGKVLTVNEDGSLSWQQKGVGGGMKEFFDAGGKCASSTSTTFEGLIGPNDTKNVTDFSNFFSGCKELINAPMLNTSKATAMNYMFFNSPKLKSVPAYDASNVTTFGGIFNLCEKIEAIHITNIGEHLDISYSKLFTREALLEILNNLKIVSVTKTLTMGSTNLAKLTDEDKAIATNKGWTLA